LPAGVAGDALAGEIRTLITTGCLCASPELESGWWETLNAPSRF